MMRSVVVTILVMAAHVVAAEPRKVLVLRSEGNADAGWRTRIDTQVLKLAKNLDGNVEAGDITFSDASTMVGCSITDLTCKDEVIGTLGVDEIVVTTVSASAAGELKVTVKRLAKNQKAQEATAAVPAGQPLDVKMNAEIGPLFGVAAIAPPPAPPEPKPVAAKPADGKPADAKLTDAKPADAKPVDAKPVETRPATRPADGKATDATAATGGTAQVRTAQTDTVTAAPDNRIDAQTAPETSRLPMYTLAAGGGLMLAGAILWMEANSTQDDINNLPPPKTQKDFRHLTDLENTGDTYALVGNVAFFGGVAIAGVSAYLYWRDRGHHGTHHARLVPTVVDHGGGVALSFGGL
jgi:hypothetical protein